MTQQVNLDGYEEVKDNQQSDYETIHFWKPQNEGDAIQGVYKGKTQTQYGEAMIVEPEEPVELENRDEPVEAFFLNYTALEGYLDEKVSEGDDVAIQFDGKVKTDSGRDMSTFTVFKR